MKLFTLEEDDLEAFRAAVLTHEEPFRLIALCDPATLNEALQIGGDRVGSLEWIYYGRESVTQVRLPPSLVSLEVYFSHHSEQDFCTAALGQCQGLQELSAIECVSGDEKSFFAALDRSAVTRLELGPNPKMSADLFAFLRKDRLKKLHVFMLAEQNPSLILEALRGCTELADLKISDCTLAAQALAGLPRSVTKLNLTFAQFAPDFNWSFLAQVTELELEVDSGVDSASLCAAFAARPGREPMKYLSMYARHALPAFPFGRIEKLELSEEPSAETLDAIAATLVLPDSQLRELTLSPEATLIKKHLLPALRDPRCRLTKLRFCGGDVEMGELANRFQQRLRLLALIEGSQLRRRQHSPLSRLPVEMFRLTGMMLM